MKFKESYKFYYPADYLKFHVNVDYNNPTLKRGNLLTPNRRAEIIKTDKDHFLVLKSLDNGTLPEEVKTISAEEFNEIKKKVLLLRKLKWRLF